MMYDQYGFYHNYYWLSVSENDIAYLVLNREEKRNAAYREAKYGKTLEDMRKVATTAKHFNEAFVMEVKQRLKARFHAKLWPRVQRLMKHRAAKNRKILAGMTPEQAMKAFEEWRDRYSSLRWYECLPYGISIQEAVNATGVSVLYSEWNGLDREGHQMTKGFGYYPESKRTK